MCAAYTGEHAELDHCPHHLCQRPRHADGPDRTQLYVVYDIVPRMRAMFSSAATSNDMRYHHQRYTETQEARAAGDDVELWDIPDGQVYDRAVRNNPGFFADPRNGVLSLAVDGTGILGKRNNNIWVVTAQFINLHPLQRHLRQNVMVLAVMRGPGTNGPPKMIDTFLQPIYAQIARLQQDGVLLFDAATGERFRWRCTLLHFTGDQEAAVAVNGMLGYKGFRGCRRCYITAAKHAEGGRPTYFPLDTYPEPPERPGAREQLFDRTRPKFDPQALPMRRHEDATRIFRSLDQARPNQLGAVQRETGHNRIPAQVFTNCFTYPQINPVEAFHVLYLDVGRDLWKILTDEDATQRTALHLTRAQVATLGQTMEASSRLLPSHFATRAARRIDKFSNTRYRQNEWAIVLHYYLIPFLIEHTEIDQDAFECLAAFVEVLSIVMSPQGATEAQVQRLRTQAIRFCTLFEEITTGGRASKIKHCT